MYKVKNIKVLIIYLLTTFLLLNNSSASNDFISSLYNELFTFKAFCFGKGSHEELNNYYKNTNRSVSPNLKSILSPQEKLEEEIFLAASQKQWLKNKCLLEKLIILKNNQKFFNTFRTLIIESFLRTKKAELIQTACYNYERIKRHNKQKGLKKEYYIDEPQIDENLKVICLNKNTLNALKLAKEIYLSTIPVVYSNELFNIVSKNSDLLINKNTENIISNEDLLNNDLTSIHFLKVDKSIQNKNKLKKMDEQIKNILSTQIEQRSSVQKELLKMNINNSEPSSSLKKIMFNDGSVLEAIIEGGMIKLDLKEKKEVLTNGAQCLLSKYIEPPLFIDISKIAVSLYFIISRNPIIFRNLIKNKGLSSDLGKLFGYSALGEQYLNNFALICNNMGLINNLDNLNQLDQQILSMKDQIGLAFSDFKRTLLPFDPDQTQSCSELNIERQKINKSLSFNDDYRINCIAHFALYFLIKAQYSIPIQLLYFLQESGN